MHFYIINPFPTYRQMYPKVFSTRANITLRGVFASAKIPALGAEWR